MLDNDKIKKFWNDRADLKEESTNLGLNGLDEKKQIIKKKIEIDKMFDYLDLNELNNFLEVGSGNGRWIFKLYDKVKSVTAVDYCESMVGVVKKKVRNLGIDNIHVFNEDAKKFLVDDIFDKILMSGLIMYLNDDSLDALFKNIDMMTRSGSEIIIRDTFGINGRYEINDKYSEALDTNYSAIYRSTNELVSMVKDYGFEFVRKENMFGDESGLNIFKETLSMMIKFRKE